MRLHPAMSVRQSIGPLFWAAIPKGKKSFSTQEASVCTYICAHVHPPSRLILRALSPDGGRFVGRRNSAIV